MLAARLPQGDHSPDNVKFPDGLCHSSVALCMLNATHIMPVNNSTKYLYGCKYAAYNKQFLGQFSPTGFFPTFP